MLDDTLRNPVHFPRKPDKFEFDAEVAAIFPNMARRSIPNYDAFHKLHAEIAARWFISDSQNAKVLDIGASHGAFFRELDQFCLTETEDLPVVQYTAIDNSASMCAHLRHNFPDANVICGSITGDAFMTMEENLYDVINCTYVIQFIEPAKQVAVLDKIGRMVRPGGMLILGQKDKHSGATGHMMQQQYIRWRIDNGYTQEEVDAKTKALKNSMWPMDMVELKTHLHRNFREVTETSRMFMFSTLIALK